MARSSHEPTSSECDSFLFWSRSLRETIDQRQQQSVVQVENLERSCKDSKDENYDEYEIDDDHSGFAMGDHVYVWCDVAGISQVYQHHGIVIDVKKQPKEKMDNNGDNQQQHCHDDDDPVVEMEWILKIADFSLIDEEETPGSFEQLTQLCASTSTASHGNANNTAGNGCGGFKVYESPAHKWLKVQYVGSERNDGEEDDKQQPQQQQQQQENCNNQNQRPPVIMRTTSSPPHLVRARVEFLLQRPELLPPYLLHESNCECVAVWVKTGTYATAQMEYWLQGTVENGAWAVGGAQLAAMTALSAVPFLVPAVVTYGAVTAGASAVALWKAKQHWKDTTEKLNRAFAQHVAAFHPSD